jgi:carbonic anhydrase
MLPRHLMLLRRQILVGSAHVMAGTAFSMFLPKASQADGTVKTLLFESLQACTPKDALTRLQEGNARFSNAWTAASATDSPEQRMHQLNSIWEQNCQIDPIALAKGQEPFAAILCCADSRVDPGWLFACGSGELFQVRSAGNTAFDEAIASLEYAVAVLGTPLVVVLGHSTCGAVKAAMASEPLTPLLEGLVKPIRANLKSGDTLTQAIEGNARYAAAQFTARSAVLKDAVAAGTLTIRSAYFDIGSGVVTWL